MQIYNLFMNKQYLVTVLLAAVAAWALFSYQTTQESYSFEQYKTDFHKSYLKNGEEQYRKSVFLRNMIKIAEHNANPEKTYEKGVNQFTDLTEVEFTAIYLTLQVPKKNIRVESLNEKVTPIVGDIDWVATGMVTDVKNQASCGSCWAFSATAALESAKMIKDGSKNNYAEQQLVDCSTSYGNQGCNGGWMDSAFDYVKANGIAVTSDYPYVARDQACKKPAARGLTTIVGYVDVSGCDSLLNALSTQPISVAVDASVWSSYKSGILSNCGTNINHGVLLVGVTDDYWKIKNSWGTSWGETGYIRLKRGNTCAICSYPSYPQL